MQNIFVGIDARYYVCADELTFKTLSLICTHQGCTIDWEASNNRFQCPCHGSQYNKDGKVTRGPAAQNLHTYQTDYDSATQVVTVTY
ncbi:Rieske 2Fe-2S domain-containing protein [candidate division KSB1 bacterium]|nr:Rieske 2Fe-2S domain-containing protein [candidate division KSB1 bacterium]